jgi:hypothetical protein
MTESPVELLRTGEGRTATHPPGDSLALQGFEVAADGHAMDAELLGGVIEDDLSACPQLLPQHLTTLLGSQ